MSKNEYEEFNTQLIKGLELAEYRMLREKAMKNQTIIQSDESNHAKKISAREVFTSIYKESVPSF